MLIEIKNISDLLPASYNPRKDLKPGDKEYEDLKNSIENFGCVEPIVWNRRNGHIIGGHQRLKILAELGKKETECVVLDLDDNQEKDLNLRLNKISGDWDLDKLKIVIDDLKLADFDLSLTGFEIEELDNLFRDEIKEKVKDDGFDVNAELVKPVLTRSGDLWHLGKHRLYCGDSTESSSYEKLMSDSKADLILTDPPYNVDYEGIAGKIKNDKMSPEKFYEFLSKAFQCMALFMADHASIYVFHADTQGAEFRRAFQESGFYLSQVCIWVKNMFVFGRSPYQWQHEPVLFGWKSNGCHRWYAGRKETTVWKYDKPQKSKEHPTMKPIPLLSYPILNSTKTGDIVLDPFGGSGSTLIACEQTGRVCFSSELDEKFCDVIVNRFIENTGSSSNVYVKRDGKKYSYDEIRGEQT